MVFTSVGNVVFTSVGNVMSTLSLTLFQRENNVILLIGQFLIFSSEIILLG